MFSLVRRMSLGRACLRFHLVPRVEFGNCCRTSDLFFCFFTFSLTFSLPWCAELYPKSCHACSTGHKFTFTTRSLHSGSCCVVCPAWLNWNALFQQLAWFPYLGVRCFRVGTSQSSSLMRPDKDAPLSGFPITRIWRCRVIYLELPIGIQKKDEVRLDILGTDRFYGRPLPMHNLLVWLVIHKRLHPHEEDVWRSDKYRLLGGELDYLGSWGKKPKRSTQNQKNKYWPRIPRMLTCI